MRTRALILLLFCLTNAAFGQGGAVKLPEQEQKQKHEKAVAKVQEKVAQQANLEIRGNHSFTDKELRSQLKEQLATVQQFGLTTARADDAAFFLELFYNEHGY